MYNKKTFLAIIPARGGSKRLPRKNVLELNNKPLIAWTIEAALKSKYIDNVIVSSDDKDILNISQNYGANIMSRPEEYASDTATITEVINHVLDRVAGYDFIVLLQPTSPLRTEQHIDSAIELLARKNADAIVSVCEAEHSPLWSNVIPNNDSLSGFLRPDVINKQSQELETYYRLNGAIYICSVNRFITDQLLMFKDQIFAYKMEQQDSVDIDTPMDFLVAELLLNRLD